MQGLCNLVDLSLNPSTGVLFWPMALRCPVPLIGDVLNQWLMSLSFPLREDHYQGEALADGPRGASGRAQGSPPVTGERAISSRRPQGPEGLEDGVLPCVPTQQQPSWP